MCNIKLRMISLGTRKILSLFIDLIYLIIITGKGQFKTKLAGANPFTL